ncbi:MAG: YeeE/YedE family protein [Paracoccaceae bacterium]|nr:YeeE/YedE family protein [Paracoccaceae bacterium]
MIDLTDSHLAALAGLAGGVMLGLAARVGRFCSMGAVEDAVYGADMGRMRMMAMAAAVAIAGTYVLLSVGAFDPNDTRYFRVAWSPIGSIVGGLLFGTGMALVGTCGFGSLARAGGGDLRGLVMVPVIGITAYATIAGPLAPLRLWIVPVVPIEDGTFDHGIAQLTASRLSVSEFVPAAIAAMALAGWALLDARFRGLSGHLVWSVIAGAAIVLAWFATSRIAATSFDQIETESYTFIAPLGQSILYLMTSGAGDLDFPLGAVAGVVLGAAIGSFFKDEFRWEACDDARELGRQMMGAAMMGVGGVLAAGCTIGQGLSALSLLSLSAPVAIVSILVGARIGLYLLVEAKFLKRGA